MRIVLHIGTEKTGTTTLQEFVYANEKELRRRGVALSGVLDKPNNRKLASFCMPRGNFDDYFKDRRISTPEQKQAHFAGFRKAFVAEARACAEWAHTLLITSEHFHSRLRDQASVRRLKNVLDPISEDVLVLCWFREQSEVVRSLYSTTIKTGNVKTIEQFSERCKPENDYFNYHAFFARWRRVFGPAALRPRLYGREHFVGGDIRRDLLSQLLPGQALDGFDFSAEAANQSLGVVGLEFGRVANRLFPRYQADGSLNPLRGALIEQLVNSELGHAGRLPVPQAQAIHAAFAPSNIRFSAQFLGRRENPFPPPPAAQADDTVTVPVATLTRFYESLLRTTLQASVAETRALPADAPAPGFAARVAAFVRRHWQRLRQARAGGAEHEP